jgi:hypothetical protein
MVTLYLLYDQLSYIEHCIIIIIIIITEKHW